MGKRGPPRESTALRLIKGADTNHRRPINKHEPEYKCEVEPPESVRKFPTALAEWKRRASELESWGILTRQDQIEFADYCCQHGIYLDLLKKIRKLGIETAIMKGFYKAFQAASLQRQRLGAKFGFTPSDRSSIVAKPKDKKDGAKRFLA
jgi:P27 family predicted phage terminase small subunit